MSSGALWIERKLRDRVDIEDVREVAGRLVAKPEALLSLAADEDGMLLLRAAELQQRMAKLREMRRIVEDVAASEYDLQQAFQAQPWIFGGQFTNTAARRSLAVGTEVDIPLLRADGSLHIVELKRARRLTAPLVVRQGASSERDRTDRPPSPPSGDSGRSDQRGAADAQHACRPSRGTDLQRAHRQCRARSRRSSSRAGPRYVVPGLVHGTSTRRLWGWGNTTPLIRQPYSPP